MDLRIFVDLQAAQGHDSRLRGLGRYAVDLTRAMLDAGVPVAAVGFSPLLPMPELARDFGSLVTPIDLDSIERARVAGPLAYHVMSPMQSTYGIDCVHPVAAQLADVQAMVVYDLIPMLFPDHYLMNDNVFDANVGRLRRVKTADLLFAISEHTRRDFIEHLAVEPSRIHTIGTGVSEFFRPPMAGENALGVVAAKFAEISRPFVLCVPTFEWRKNPEVLIDAFALLPVDLRRNHQLVFACALPPTSAETWRARARQVGLNDDELVLTGYVDDHALRDLYQAARLFVFPSRYEGFGLPVAEAARCGAPALTGAAGSLPEVLNCEASVFDVDDAKRLASRLAIALVEGAERTELLAASARAAQTHTWANVARRLLDAYQAYERIHVGTRANAAERVPRVGWVGAGASAAAAIADLRGVNAHVDVFEDAGAGDWPPSVGGNRFFPISALGTVVNPYDYDVVVYDLTTQSVDVLDALALRPGVVFLDKVDLSTLLARYADLHSKLDHYGPEPRRRRSAAQIMADVLAGYPSAQNGPLAMACRSAACVVVPSEAIAVQVREALGLDVEVHVGAISAEALLRCADGSSSPTAIAHE